MTFHRKRREIRTNEEIEEKAEKLLLSFPELFRSYSDVYRAGVMTLYKKRESDLNDVEKKNRVYPYGNTTKSIR